MADQKSSYHYLPSGGKTRVAHTVSKEASVILLNNAKRRLDFSNSFPKKILKHQVYFTSDQARNRVISAKESKYTTAEKQSFPGPPPKAGQHQGYFTSEEARNRVLSAKSSRSTENFPKPPSAWRSFPKPGPQPKAGVVNIQTDCTEFTTTVTDTEKIQNLLDVHGFAIVENVLTSEECYSVIDGTWDSMEKITAGLDIPLKRNIGETWPSIKKQKNLRNMYSGHGIVHAEFFWRLRQNPKILSVFCQAYGGGCQPRDLLASFDGLSFQTPPEYNTKGVGWYRNCWYHVDQSFTRPQRECFQSWVTARDVTSKDFTIGFFAGSHRDTFREFGRTFGITKTDNSYKLQSPQEMEFYENRHTQIRITCTAGSLVIWDSRLLHSGLEPIRGRKKPAFRTVCFLSYGPRVGVPQRILNKRVHLYETRRATTHWAHKGMKTIPEENSHYDRLIKLKANPQENKLMRRLIGYND